MSEVQYWSTDLVPERDRFEAWNEKVLALHMDWDLSSPVAGEYAADIRYRKAGSARVADVRCEAFQGRRNPSADAGVVGVQLQLSGRMACRYGEEQFSIEPGDLFVWNSFPGGTFHSEGRQRQLSLLVPVARVSKAVTSAIERSRPLSARPGAGLFSIVADQLGGIMRELEHLHDDAVDRSVNSLLDLLDSALTPAPESTAGQRGALLAEIKQYILDRLHDSRMSVSSIADAHWISVRSLHLAFSESGTSVARWIREQRLERCRRDLVNASGSTTVTEVAFRWGFTDTSHFSRAFKREFGVPPIAVMRR